MSGINIMERIENETMDFEFSLFNKYSDLEKWKLPRSQTREAMVRIRIGLMKCCKTCQGCKNNFKKPPLFQKPPAKQLYWNHTSAWCSSANLLHVFRIPFLNNTSGGLLLNFWTYVLWNSQQFAKILLL